MKKNLDTLCVQAGYNPKDGDPRVTPIVQSTTFTYDSVEQMANLFDLKASGHFYSRLSNPTCEVLEGKITALEGGSAALATSSGQSATLCSILNVAQSGDHILVSSEIYGGTFNLLNITIRKMGIEATFVNPNASIEEIEAKIRPNTKVIFAETIANPACVVLDFEKFAKVSKKYGILFIVDNTLATPCLCRPFEFGANVIVHASTKYLDGHAVAVGGLIVDGGNFDFAGNPRYECMNKPDSSYHGLVYSTLGKIAYIVKARVQLMRDLGCCMSPMNAFLTNLGTETLHLRMARTSENALKVAKMLSENSEVEFVKYAGLETDKSHELCKKYLSGAGGMLIFGLKGDKARATTFIENLKLVRHVTHIADARSSVLHPASTTHRQLSDSELTAAGIKPNLIRLSIGIENGDEIVEDIRQAILKA